MRDWKNPSLSPDTLLLEARRIIDTRAMQISLVVDVEPRAVGVVTDGDFMRGILTGRCSPGLLKLHRRGVSC